jgi:hypothetical protein
MPNIAKNNESKKIVDSMGKFVNNDVTARKWGSPEEYEKG